MRRIYTLIILAFLSPNAFGQDKWSLETTWKDGWGHTGPGIYADWTGKLRLHKKEERSSLYLCKNYTLSSGELSALEKIVTEIPKEIPYFSNLYIGDGCSDEREMQLRVDIDGKWRLIKYTQPDECRWDEATPGWLSELDALLQDIFSRVKDCA